MLSIENTYILVPVILQTFRHCERSEAISVSLAYRLEIAASLRSFMPSGYRNDVLFCSAVVLLDRADHAEKGVVYPQRAHFLQADYVLGMHQLGVVDRQGAQA